MKTREQELRYFYHILLTKGGNLLPGESKWLAEIEEELTR